MPKGHMKSKLSVIFIVVATSYVFIRGVVAVMAKTTPENWYLRAITIVTLIVGVMGVALVSYLTLRKNWKLTALYPIMAVLLGCLYLVAIPIFSSPDEPYHFNASYNLSNKMLGIKDTDGEEEKSLRRASDVEYQKNFYDEPLTFRSGLYETYQKELLRPVDDTLVLARDRAKGAANIVSYFLPAVALTIGRLLHMNLPMMASLAMVFDMLWFIAWMSYALKKIPFGQKSLFVIALLPVTLQQASSITRDINVILGGIIVLSLSLRWRYSGEQIKKSEIIVFILASIALVTVKGAAYAYLILFLFVLFFDKNWLRGRKKYIWIGVCLTVIALVVVYLFGMHGWDTVYAWLTQPRMRESTMEYGPSVWYYITHPFVLLKLMLATAIDKGPEYIYHLTGQELGWMDITNSRYMKMAYFAVMVLSVVRTQDEREEISSRVRIWGIVFTVAGVLMSLLSMLIYWTAPDAKIIEGVQGRYFLPFLILTFLALGYWKKPVVQWNLKKWLPVFMTILGFNSVITIFVYSLG